ncbi:hypothetical protein ACCS95_06865 [Rhizobium ruizarguesonis]
MALSGLHVVAGYSGSYLRHRTQALLARPVWSEAPASGVTTANSAPADLDNYGQPLFRIRAAADSFVSVGKVPNATSGTRFLVPAGSDYDLFVEFGDKLQWIAA